jgi:YfiH family protein
MCFETKNFNAVEWLEFKALQKFSNIKHFTTTKLNGVSFYPNGFLNMGFVQTDEPQNVVLNRNLFSIALGISVDSFVFANQSHSDNILVVTEEHKGRGVNKEDTEIQDIDSFIVEESGICPVVQSADCVPIIVYEPQRHIGAVVHSGWRGTFKRILEKTILKMIQMGANPSEMIVCIGPSAGVCCYEVKDDVLQSFIDNYDSKALEFFRKENDKMYLDLWKANSFLAKNIGVLEQNISVAGLCSIDNSNKFFSARVHKQYAGRMATGIMLL